MLVENLCRIYNGFNSLNSFLNNNLKIAKGENFMEKRVYAKPAWLLEFRSKALQFLKVRREIMSGWNEMLEERTKVRNIPIERIIEINSRK